MNGGSYVLNPEIHDVWPMIQDMEGTTAQNNTSSATANALGASFLDPAATVNFFDLKSGDSVADFGCGAGFFVIPVARAVGSAGRVYAIDIQKEMLAALRAKAQTANLLNVDYIWADLEEPSGSHLKDGSVDFVVIANILFQAPDKLQILREAFRILKPAARVAVIEWDESVSGPPLPMRISRTQVSEFSKNAGLLLVRELEVGSHHYGMLFIKPR